MDPDQEFALDQLIERTSTSALNSLDAVIDVEQRLRELYREVGLEPTTNHAPRPRSSRAIHKHPQ